MFDSISSDNFTVIVDTITGVFPLVVAISVPLIALRKGWSFLVGNIKRA